MGYKQWSAGDVLTAADINAYLMNQAVIACTSGTRPGSPVEGMVIAETDTKRVQLYSGSGWVLIGHYGNARGPWDAFQGANDTTASTTYVAGTNHGVSFVAPASGQVLVSYSGSIASNAVAAGAGVWLSFEVRTGSTIGSGTVTQAADDPHGVYLQPNNANSGFKYAPAAGRFRVQSLTAGSTYHVRTMFRNDTAGSTVAVLNRNVLVESVL